MSEWGHKRIDVSDCETLTYCPTVLSPTSYSHKSFDLGIPSLSWKRPHNGMTLFLGRRALLEALSVSTCVL